nr:hypothetical protein [Tanacetum cinerariifolium]
MIIYIMYAFICFVAITYQRKAGILAGLPKSNYCCSQGVSLIFHLVIKMASFRCAGLRFIFWADILGMLIWSGPKRCYKSFSTSPTSYQSIEVLLQRCERMAECENCSPQQPPRAQPRKYMVRLQNGDGDNGILCLQLLNNENPRILKVFIIHQLKR